MHTVLLFVCVCAPSIELTPKTHANHGTAPLHHTTQAGYGDGAAGLWVMLFTVSKVFELVDTVILVLKGKDPMFLHWCVRACVAVEMD